MDRNATNNRQWFAVLGTQARELTDAELDCVSGRRHPGCGADDESSLSPPHSEGDRQVHPWLSSKPTHAN
jgi:hypothetical protein